MNLGSPPDQYDKIDQSKMRAVLAAADKANIKRNTIIERWVMISPNGTKYYFTVSDAGAPVFTAV